MVVGRDHILETGFEGMICGETHPHLAHWVGRDHILETGFEGMICGETHPHLAHWVGWSRCLIDSVLQFFRPSITNPWHLDVNGLGHGFGANQQCPRAWPGV